MKNRMFLVIFISILFFSCNNKVYRKDNISKVEKIDINSDSLEFVYPMTKKYTKEEAIEAYKNLIEKKKYNYAESFLENEFKKQNESDFIFMLLIKAEEKKKLNKQMQYYLELKTIFSENAYEYDRKIYGLMTKIDKADFYFNESKKAYLDSDLLLAKNELRKGMDLISDNDDINYFYNILTSRLIISKKNPEILANCLSYLDKAIAIKPEEGEPYYLKALAYFMYNKLDRENILNNFDNALSKKLDDGLKREVISNKEKFLKMNQ
ncbi:MAG: hypothetical protein JXR48_17560 [Candidatus Delongbacteria bacterium]|nr:hypothetical protein [Candidatus Delongbacteria bacterium]MBN2836765.1 hypothetical protein [Candidatus Delongbacteria bacterium]